MYRVEVAVVALSCHVWSSSALKSPSTEKGACEFENEPLGVGYFWDPTCGEEGDEFGGLGCFADANNTECRFCGAGDFLTIDCPPSSCHFHHQPVIPYYWDKECVAGELGCWADGIHAQCRYCGDYPFTSLPCPVGAAPPSVAGCAFDNATVSDTPHYWEPGCDNGTFGCRADGMNTNCRYCGAGNYADIPCPASQVCTFANEPSVPYFWDPSCEGEGGLGCHADGIHQECRFCAVRPFQDVPCPGQVAPPENTCTWPLHGEPVTPSVWDPTCTIGDLGCWADGLHAACRFCGQGVFATISCVEAATGNGSNISVNASDEAQNGSQISANASVEAQNGSNISANTSGEAQNGSQSSANTSVGAQNGSQISANTSDEAHHGSNISANASGEAQNGGNISANTSANGSSTETTIVAGDENQTNQTNQTNQSNQTDENQTHENQSNQTSARSRTSFARAFDIQEKNTSMEAAEWWDELNAAVPHNFVLAVLTMTLPLLQ